MVLFCKCVSIPVSIDAVDHRKGTFWGPACLTWSNSSKVGRWIMSTYYLRLKSQAIYGALQQRASNIGSSEPGLSMIGELNRYQI